MRKGKKYLLDILVVIVLVIIACIMLKIGRGHTVYFDNKAITADGKSYEAFYQVEVYVDDARVAKLKAGDRGSTTVIGQKLEVVFHLKKEEDSKKSGSKVVFDLPQDIDGIIYNLPALFYGAPQEVYQQEFVPAPPVDDDEEVILTDEFVMEGDA